MFGIGLWEILFVLLIGLLVFGAPVVIAFFVGYKAGQKKAVTTVPSAGSGVAQSQPEDKAPTEENADE